MIELDIFQIGIIVVCSVWVGTIIQRIIDKRRQYLMDIEELIEDLRGLLKQYGEKIPYGELVGAPWPYSMDGDLVWQDPEPYFIEQAATALSTLQAENEKLREELEQIPSCIYYKQGGLCRYGGNNPANVCVLGPCDHDVSVQDVLTELEQVKAERDAIEQDFRDFTKQWWEEDSGFPCRWCKSENSGGCEWKAKHPGEICAGRAFEWRGPQKED